MVDIMHRNGAFDVVGFSLRNSEEHNQESDARVWPIRAYQKHSSNDAPLRILADPCGFLRKIFRHHRPDGAGNIKLHTVHSNLWHCSWPNGRTNCRCAKLSLKNCVNLSAAGRLPPDWRWFLSAGVPPP